VNWESQEQFEIRMAERRANPIVPLPLRVWYHCAVMGNYRDVVREHAAIFSALDLHPTACVVGDKEGADWVSTIWPVAYHSENLRDYETPTLQKLWEDCRANPTGAVLYCHTKGVGSPQHVGKAAWRRLMDRHVIGDYEANLQRLTVADIVGVDWQHNKSHPHFSGNFWMARADWIARLDSPTDYRAGGGPWIAGNPWDRMHAEMWLGSKTWHHVESLVVSNWCIWNEECVGLLHNHGAWL
jgi:hypothetical protein